MSDFAAAVFSTVLGVGLGYFAGKGILSLATDIYRLLKGKRGKPRKVIAVYAEIMCFETEPFDLTTDYQLLASAEGSDVSWRRSTDGAVILRAGEIESRIETNSPFGLTVIEYYES